MKRSRLKKDLLPKYDPPLWPVVLIVVATLALFSWLVWAMMG